MAGEYQNGQDPEKKPDWLKDPKLARQDTDTNPAIRYLKLANQKPEDPKPKDEGWKRE